MSSVIERFDQLVDKLPTFTHIEVEDVRRFTNAGEWQLALDLLLATAIMRKRGLSQEVYAEICALALLVHLEQPERLSLLTVDNLDRSKLLGWSAKTFAISSAGNCFVRS
ncbi:MAG: hypothetical protein NT168_17505 [Planctomycetota bacterium]|nr:hypothetical protein [Planctomycetota bacterium]